MAWFNHSEETKNEAREQYRQGVPVTTIARELGIGAMSVYRWTRDVADRKPAVRPSGESHPSWKGGRYVDSAGYVRIRDSGSSKYVQEHRAVMEQVLARPLESWETVHHVDGDRQNNDPANLQLRSGRHGSGVVYRCGCCGSDNVVPVTLA